MFKMHDLPIFLKMRLAARWFLSATALAGLAFVASPSALAQEGAEIEEVVVTGSRLVRRDLDAASPVVVISDAQIRSAGNVTIEETLNEMPQLASDNTSSVNSGGGSGILTANLRGLDAVRTLVLVNGRRFAPADSRGLTDLSSIPDALVERVEVMTGGASAVYGSDAIAGAINFRLKDDFEGLEFGYYLGETAEGDATTQKFDLTVGGNFAEGRGNAAVSVSYTDRGEIFFADRSYSAISLFESGTGLVPGGSSNLPGTRLTLSSTQLASLNGIGFDPTSACPGTIGGVRFGDQGTVVPYCDPEDRFNFAPLNYLLRPLERIQISTIGHYDINDNVTAYTELFYMNNRNEWQQAPNAGGLQTSGAPRGDYLIPDFANNPVLFPATTQFLVDNAAIFDSDGDGTAVIQGTGRRSVETGPRNYKYDRNSFSTLVGLRGEFEAGGRDWNWDTFFQFQHAKTDEDIAGQLSQLRLSLGSDVTVDPMAPGGVRCTNEFVGCVPVNFLGLNSVSPEAAAFISPNHGVTDVLERQIYGGFISGDLFELPAGPVAVGLGFEERRDDYDFRPDTAAQGGEFGDPQPPIEASIDLTEFFAEARVPLIEGAAMADYLGLELAVRTSDYSTVGNVSTWKAGIEWAPNDWLRFRGMFNQAIRSPNLDELFDTVAIGFTAGDDLCDINFNPSAAAQAECVLQGVSQVDIDTFTHLGVGFGIRSGGNPDLREEEADTFTVGAVISPPFLEGLNLTIDYYDIEITNAINQLTAQEVVNNCFRPDNLDHNSETCQAINRFGNGQIDFVDARSLNVASINATGLDFQADYSWDLGNTMAFFGPASLDLQLVASWAFENEKVSEPGQPGVDCLGVFGGVCSGFNDFIQPETKYVFNTNYHSGDFSGRFQWRNISSVSLFPGAANPIKSGSAVNYLDLNFDYVFNENVTVFLGIDNLTDEEPPIFGFSIAGDANVDISLYDVLGRRYFAGVRVRL
ncbi:MAG: TonB-dependent receptor plug domain-containing protein [Woeseiaceae bacterium]